jgi:hypothetical protein
MVAHHSVGDDAQLAEFLIQPHETDKLFFLVPSKDELPVHDTGYTVVVRKRARDGGFDSGFTYGGWVECAECERVATER